MRFSLKQQWLIFIAVNASALLLLFVAFPIYYKYIRPLPMNKCNMLEILHLYCPGCGGTRAFRALCELDIIASFKYNATVPLGAVAFIIYEVVMIKHLIQRTEREFFFRPWMIYSFLIFWLVLFVVRNALLLFGIDVLGNILI